MDRNINVDVVTKVLPPCVLYWMQEAKRFEFNPAFDYAYKEANNLNLPLVVYFGVVDHFSNISLSTNKYSTSARHYKFLFERLEEIIDEAKEKEINFIITEANFPKSIIELAKVNAKLLVTEISYVSDAVQWKSELEKKLAIPVRFINTQTCFLPNEIYPKHAVGARVLRPRLNNVLNNIDYKNIKLRKNIKRLNLPSMSSIDLKKLFEAKFKVPFKSKYSSFVGTRKECMKYLNEFLNKKIEYYHQYKNDPCKNYCSNMSPYLHFGIISPVEILHYIFKKDMNPGVIAYLEELIVRRELSFNHVYYCKEYWNYFQTIPLWAQKTLSVHQGDEREYCYSYQQLANGETHDQYWNAAQREMVITGKMHGYMRMYWGKKIIEWSKNPQDAFKNAIILNDTYSLDGRDPNGCVGVSWCFGLHDRPWQERKIFGTVRYMNAEGLKRKFDIDRYISKIKSISL